MKIPSLETERLILRPISIEDAPSIQKHFNNWEIIKYLSENVPWPYPNDGTENFLRTVALPSVESRESIIWAITPKQGEHKGEAIGVIHYRLKGQIQDSDRGFWLSAEYHRKGLMTEAVAVTQDFIFEHTDLEKLRVRNVISNIGSRRLKEKMGGVLIYTEDKPCGRTEGPTEVWEITQERWSEIRGRS